MPDQDIAVTRDDTGMRICNTPGCGRKHSARGMCKKHWKRAYASVQAFSGLNTITGQPRKYLRRESGQLCATKDCGRPVQARMLYHSCYPKFASRKRSCSVPGCEGRFFGQGLCQVHHARALYAGHIKPVRPRGDAAERFAGRVGAADAAGCTRWMGTRDAKSGRGVFTAERQRVTQAHRFAYRYAYGDIPVDDSGRSMHLEHRCRVVDCVNPEHLEPVTAKVNAHRGRVASGHRAITEADTVWFFIALRAFVEGADNFPARVVTTRSRVTVWEVAA